MSFWYLGCDFEYPTAKANRSQFVAPAGFEICRQGLPSLLVNSFNRLTMHTFLKYAVAGQDSPAYQLRAGVLAYTSPSVAAGYSAEPTTIY